MRKLKIGLILALLGCRDGVTLPPEEPFMTQEQTAAFVRGFFSEDVFVFNEWPLLPGDFQPGVPFAWNRTVNCKGGGSASFAGTATIGASASARHMDLAGVLTATRCTFTADGITITLDADQSLEQEGRLSFAVVEDVEDFSMSFALRSFGDFNWTVDHSWAAGEIDWSGSCPMDLTLTADVSLEAIQSGDSRGTVTGTVCWRHIHQAVGVFGNPVP